MSSQPALYEATAHFPIPIDLENCLMCATAWILHPTMLCMQLYRRARRTHNARKGLQPRLYMQNGL